MPDAHPLPPLLLRDLDLPGMTAALGPLGVPGDVTRRVFASIHKHGATTLDGVRGLSRAAAGAIAARAVWPQLELVERRRSGDGFVKYLFRLPDGHAIEAVRIPLPDPGQARALRARRSGGGAAGLEALPAVKYTVCVSSQAGCALACDFCATGRLGAIRSLRTWEILQQVRAVADEAEHPVRGVVFMGMGEPFLNFDNVIRAAKVLSDPCGPGVPGRAISISTAGVVPAIRRFTAEGHRFRLIVSLGAPTSDQRAQLMPIERRWPLPELMAALRDHGRATGKRVNLAYVTIGGVNVSPEHARALGALLEGLPVKMHLIDVADETGRYQPPTPQELSAFRDALTAALPAPVTRRYSGGKEIGAACGTLSASHTGGDLVELPRLRQRIASTRTP